MNKYINLVKPGIVCSNTFTAFTGMFIAGYGKFDFTTLAWALVGIILVLASSTMLNNYIDRDIDKFMSRTKERLTVTGDISFVGILFASAIFCILGITVLYVCVNTLTVLVVLFGYFVYIVLYSLYSKRTSSWSTFIGSFSGASLPLAGYVAIANRIDTLGIILFLILLAWQMPHFYAITIFRREEYKVAGLPVMAVSTSIENTRNHIFIWTILFLIITMLPSIYGYSGMLYLIAMIVINGYWVIIAYSGFKAKNVIKWSKKVFFYSLFNLLAVCIVLMVDKVIVSP